MQNLVETLTIYIRFIFQKIGQQDLTDEKFIQELVNKIFADIFDELIEKRIPADKRQAFADDFIKNAQDDKNKFFDQLAELITTNELNKLILDKTNAELQRIIKDLYDSRDIKKQDLERLEWFLVHPNELQAIDKVNAAKINSSSNETQENPDDILKTLAE